MSCRSIKVYFSKIDLGCDRQVFPIRSAEGLRYLRARGKQRRILNDSLEYSSERWLIGFMFAISASLCGLAIYQTTVVIHSLANEGQSFSQILSVITNATRL